MQKFSTAERLQQFMSETGLKQIDIIRKAEPFYPIYKVKIGRNDISQYIAGKVIPRQNKLFILAKALNVSEAWLMGYDVPKERIEEKDETTFNIEDRLLPPTITEDTVTFPILGEIAAGYDMVAVEDWSGETIEIPRYYLKGRPMTDYFVLRVHGDSMYPQYQDGDIVLILKQTTLNRSGEIGAVIYEDDVATLKKVEYVPGENWMEMIPLNLEFKPKRIEGEALEHCRILGIPKLLIREI